MLFYIIFLWNYSNWVERIFQLPNATKITFYFVFKREGGKPIDGWWCIYMILKGTIYLSKKLLCTVKPNCFFYLTYVALLINKLLNSFSVIYKKTINFNGTFKLDHFVVILSKVLQKISTELYLKTVATCPIFPFY